MQSVNLKTTRKQWLVPLGLCVLLWMGPLAFGGESTDGGGILRSRVYSLEHITSAQARDLFSQLNIGQSYNMLTPDVLIVTSSVGADLVAATEIINVLDQMPPVQIRVLMVVSKNNPAPSLDEFFATLGTISAGTMTEAPPRGADRPAIIDVLGDELIVIAAEDVQAQIKTAMADWQKQHPTPISKVRDVPAPSLEQRPQAAQEEPPMPVEPKETEKPEAMAEVNALSIVSDSNERTDAVLEATTLAQPEVSEEPPLVPMATAPQGSAETAITEVAQQLFDSPPTADVNEPAEARAEPNAPVAAKPQENDKEDFLNKGLLEVLADAEQKTVPTEVKAPVEPTPERAVAVETAEEVMPEQTADTSETAVADEPIQETAPEEKDDPLAMMQALLAQAKADEERALTAQKEEEAQALRAKQKLAEANKVQPVEPAEETDVLKAELALLRQQLAQLEAKAAEETMSVPADVAAVRTTDSVRTEPQIDPQLAEEELETVIDLPQEVELEALIDLVGKQLGLNYMYDPAKLKNQKVQLKLHGGKIKVRDTYALLESVLRFKGFIMTRRDQLVTILPQADIAKAEPVLRGVDDPIQPGDIVVSSMFELEHIDAASAQNMLQGMNLGTAFTPIAGTKTLIVTDFAYRMDQIRRVLDMVDVPGEEKEYQFRTLKYMKPSEIVPKLQELAGQLQGVSLQISTPATAQKTRSVRTRDPKTGRTVTKQVPITTSTPAAAQTPQAEAVFIDPDDRTNRIFMSGKADQIELINELVDVLDVPQYDLKSVREYIIENVEAGEVIDVLNELALASVSVQTQQTTPTSSRTRKPAKKPMPQPAPSTGADGSEQPYISVRPATNSLLVNATAEQHKHIELVIAHVDVVQKDQRTIRQYEIQYVDTAEIIETLTDLEIIAPQTASTGSRSTSSRSSRQTNSRSPQQPPAAEGAAPLSLPSASGGSQKDITADQPQISVLETTNSLLVYATPRQHDAIALVIAHADRQLDTSSTPYVVYALENQDPLLLAEVLTKLIQETVEEVKKTSTPTSKIQSGGATPTANLPSLEEQNIRVIPDEMSYSLIVYANKRNQQWISELIKELDEYRPQVLLDCTLVEILKDDAFQYSLDIIAKTYGASSIQSGSPVAVTAIYGDFSKRTLGDISSIGGDVTGFFNSQMIQGVLEAVQRNGYGRVMAQPKILVNDNQEGEIKTENKTSVAQKKSSTIPGTGGSDPIISDDVSFVEYSEGVTLTIKPHISKGDMLRLEVKLQRTDFDDSIKDVTVDGKTYPKPPDLISTDVTTVATVPDGTTIILGGLESVGQAKTQSKVPLLGDLPLIGILFRGVDNTDKQRRLYVFVKANIIRPGDQAEGLEDIRRVEF